MRTLYEWTLITIFTNISETNAITIIMNLSYKEKFSLFVWWLQGGNTTLATKTVTSSLVGGWWGQGIACVLTCMIKSKNMRPLVLLAITKRYNIRVKNEEVDRRSSSNKWWFKLTPDMFPFGEQQFTVVCRTKHAHYLLGVGDKVGKSFQWKYVVL